MRDLPPEVARIIAKRQYWDVLRGDDIDALSPAIAAELVDTGVHMGQAVSAGFLQRSLNVLNGRGRSYGDLVVDGLVGPITIAALRSYLVRREDEGERVMLRLLNCLQGARYVEITEAREANKDFLYGWIRARVAL